MHIFTLELDTLHYPALHELIYSEESKNNTLLHTIDENKYNDNFVISFLEEHIYIRQF